MPALVLPQLAQRLRDRLGDRFVLDTSAALSTYECDAFTLAKHRPQLVALPNSTDEVAFVVQQCIAAGVPYTARGSGTGLSGGAMPIEGGILISLNRMNRILDIQPENRSAQVEVGVINASLNEALAPYGLFYAPDPSSQAACTIGGNIAENAGGIHCIKYGVTTDHILSLEVILPNGEITWLGSGNRRSHGPNLVALMVGSEGTLGIVTRAVVRLTPKPIHTRVYLCAFPTVRDAGATVSDTIKQGLLPSALEFMDAFTVRAVNQAFDVGFPEQAEAVLLIELDGSPEQVGQDEQQLNVILQTHHVSQIRVGQTPAERQALWKARKGTVAAYGRFLPAFYLHDCVIPRSKLVNILETIQAVGKNHQVTIGNVFHAGDGNLHPNVLFDPEDLDMVKRAMSAGDEILRACLAMGGTLSGEHGIGLEKAHFMGLQFSEASLERMRAVKACFDPLHLSNPGKMFPQRAGCGETRAGLSPPALRANGIWI